MGVHLPRVTGGLRLPHPGLAYDAPLAHYTGVTPCGHVGVGAGGRRGKDGAGAAKLPRPPDTESIDFIALSI